MRNIKNKKGLSTIVTTLIIVALSLVAVGIIWVVVNNILQNRSTEINYLDKCTGQSIEVTQATCTYGGSPAVAACSSVSLMRTLGSETIAGVRLVFTDSSGNKVISDQGGDITTTKILSDATAIPGSTFSTLTGKPKTVEAIAYFNGTNSQAQICPSGSEFAVPVA